MKAKTKQHWWQQDSRDASDKAQLPTEAADGKESLFKRITIRSEFNIAAGVAFRAHIITPCASDGRHISLALNVCPASFQSSLNKFSLPVLQFFSFGMGVFAHA